jgi:hypothetical protein
MPMSTLGLGASSSNLLQTVRASAGQLRDSLLDSLSRHREQRAEDWERDRREWLDSIRTISTNWREELGREIVRANTDLELAAGDPATRHRATDLFVSLPCVPTSFPDAASRMIVDSLRARSEALGPLKAAALQEEGDVCSICLEHMQAGEQAISLPACHHIFHWDCIYPWIRSKGANADCPFCKRPICPELTLEENKWAVSIVERQLALERIRAREETMRRARAVDVDGVRADSERTQEDEEMIDVLYAHAQSQNSANTRQHRVERDQLRRDLARTQGQAQAQTMTRINEQREPTRVQRNLTWVAQQLNESEGDLAGSLDIDWDWSSPAGRRVTAAARIRQVISQDLAATMQPPSLRGGMVRRLNTLRRARRLQQAAAEASQQAQA